MKTKTTLPAASAIRPLIVRDIPIGKRSVLRVSRGSNGADAVALTLLLGSPAKRAPRRLWHVDMPTLRAKEFASAINEALAKAGAPVPAPPRWPWRRPRSTPRELRERSETSGSRMC